MKIGIIYREILLNPHSTKPYRKLYECYLELGMTHEANAIADLIKRKFGDNVALDDTPNSKK